jgi:hypothetical protein
MTQTTPRIRLSRLVGLLVAAAVSAMLLAGLVGVTNANASVSQRQTYVSAGDYRTLATLWNTTASAEFQCPAGAKIRVRYGGGWFAKNRQEQTLNCVNAKRLSVGAWSVFVARMQIKVPESGYVNWAYITEGPS